MSVFGWFVHVCLFVDAWATASCILGRHIPEYLKCTCYLSTP